MNKKTVNTTMKTTCTIVPGQPYVDIIATGKNLRYLRKKHKFTQEKAADCFYGAITPASISAWENGKYLPDLNKLVVLGNVYGGYTLDDIIVLSYPKENTTEVA